LNRVSFLTSHELSFIGQKALAKWNKGDKIKQFDAKTDKMTDPNMVTLFSARAASFHKESRFL